MSWLFFVAGLRFVPIQGRQLAICHGVRSSGHDHLSVAPSNENRYWSSQLRVRSVTVSLTPQLIDGQPQRDPSDRQGESGQAES